MAVLIDNQQVKYPVEIQDVARKAQVILDALGNPDGELSVLIVDDDHIARLNQRYLNHEGPTNVISFPMREGPHGDLHPELLGDVVISMDTCVRESRDADMPIEQRFLELLVHGVLHLFGFDHIHSKVEERAMEDKSRALIDLVRQQNS